MAKSRNNVVTHGLTSLFIQANSFRSILKGCPDRVVEQQPRTADVFGIYFPEKGRIAHVGFVDEWNGTWLITVEGNTNLSGSREGDRVYRKRRLVRSIYQVARYIADTR